MSWRTSPAILALRNLGRRTGFNQWLGARVGSADYEDRFQKQLLAEIRPGDCVWDVGANVGLYSTIFSGIVGPVGNVFAFEPSPKNFARLETAVAPLKNVTLMPMALGETPGPMAFAEGSDAIGATSRVIPKGQAPKGQATSGPTVDVWRGDDLVRLAKAAVPNVMKIDTEGFELEVLRGLTNTLRDPRVRTLGIEIHFTLLNERGLVGAAREIESLLQSSGFTCVWPDASHIVANRTA